MGGRSKQMNLSGCMAIVRSKKSAFRGDVCGRRADYRWRSLKVCGLHKRGWNAFDLIDAMVKFNTVVSTPHIVKLGTLEEIEALAKETEALTCGLTLAGWFCSLCKVFNGEEKEKRYECRACGIAHKLASPQVVAGD